MIKLQIVRRFSPRLLDANQAYSFINFASISSFFEQTPNTVAYFCDGMLMSLFMSRVTGRAIGRVSFDFTSIADAVLGSEFAGRTGPIDFAGTSLIRFAFGASRKCLACARGRLS